jgi:hypothetical protein
MGSQSPAARRRADEQRRLQREQDDREKLERAERRANALAKNPDLSFQSEFTDLYDAEGRPVDPDDDISQQVPVYGGDPGDDDPVDYEEGDPADLTPEQHLRYLKWMDDNDGDWHRASQALEFDTRQAQAAAPGAKKGAGELLSGYFGDEGRDPADFAAALITDRDRAGWEQALRAAATEAGVKYDPSDLEGVIRNFSYFKNAGKDPQDFIDDAIESYRVRGQSGGQRFDAEGNPLGGYHTGWADPDPSRYSAQPTDTTPGTAGADPSAAYQTELERLQGLQDALPRTDTAGRAAIQTDITAMYSGAFDTAQAAKKAAADKAAADKAAAAAAVTATVNTPPPPPNVQTMANVLPTPKVPYSARAIPGTVPVPPVTTATTVGPPSTAATTSVGTVADITNQSNEDLYDDTSWNNTNNNYWQSLNGTGFNPAPWGGRRGLQRTGFDNNGRPVGGFQQGRQGQVGSDDSSASGFGRRERRRNQYNADLGQQDFQGQMGNWLRAYDAWRKQGPRAGRIDPTEANYDPNNPGVV